MLVPAVLRRNEIEEAFKKYYYTDDMMYETGGLCNWRPDIAECPDAETFQFAIVSNDSDERLIGYLAYNIDWYDSCAHNFLILSFDRGNPIVGKDLYNEMEKLVNEYKLHRIEYRMVGGNPIEKHYDKYCEKYNGRKLILKDATKDKYGVYHDDMIYEIINDN